VGASAAKALTFGLGLPVYGVSSLDAIAYQLRQKAKKICVLVDARRNLFYGSLYTSDGSKIKRVSDYLLSPPQDILKKCTPGSWITGDGCALIEAARTKGLNIAPKSAWKPQARNVLALLEERIKARQGDDAACLVPIYLYPEDCQAVRHKA
jgi:tRNA threonylcarbamoyladenosine biosynthesis protein TsaB